jgi:two-component system sensor histidine kinase DesK
MARIFRKELGWTPFLYLIYVFFVFMQAVLDHAKAREWVVTLVGFALFLPCYVGAFQRWRPGAGWYALGMAILGMASLPVNGGTGCYFIYAGGALGFIFSSKMALRWLWALMGAFGIELWVLKAPVWFAVFLMLLTLAVSLSNVQFGEENRANAKLKMAQDELEHLAKVAERERIARDLHDVLGHTLSVIVLKAELAAKLFERDAERSKTEMRQVEQIARAALGEVRQAIGGYRAASVAEEFARAKETLETAGVLTECKVNASEERMPTPVQETLLALVVREAVTNVVRHASATRCHLSIEEAANGWRLSIYDDGRGGKFQEGNGLRGMRERVEAVGGQMLCESRRGTKLDFFIPRRLSEDAVA